MLLCTNLCFLLKVERVHLLELSLKAEEKGSSIRLERSLRVLQRLSIGTLL